MEDIKYQEFYFKLTILDSYKVKQKDYEKCLEKIKTEIPNCKLWQTRTMKSLEYEWAVHNFCYKLGIKRDKTKDVDFEFVQEKKISILYKIIGGFLFFWK